MIRRLIFSSILAALSATTAWTQRAPLTLQEVLDKYVVNNLELQAASVLGRNVSGEIVAAIAQTDVNHAREWIGGLIESDFLNYAGADAPFEFSFRHPLVQEVSNAW